MARSHDGSSDRVRGPPRICWTQAASRSARSSSTAFSPRLRRERWHHPIGMSCGRARPDRSGTSSSWRPGLFLQTDQGCTPACSVSVANRARRSVIRRVIFERIAPLRWSRQPLDLSTSAKPPAAQRQSRHLVVPPDLVLMDMRLRDRDTDGFEVARILRSARSLVRSRCRAKPGSDHRRGADAREPNSIGSSKCPAADPAPRAVPHRPPPSGVASDTTSSPTTSHLSAPGTSAGTSPAGLRCTQAVVGPSWLPRRLRSSEGSAPPASALTPSFAAELLAGAARARCPRKAGGLPTTSATSVVVASLARRGCARSVPKLPRRPPPGRPRGSRRRTGAG
jgi:CheY-like chemotaxis protein